MDIDPDAPVGSLEPSARAAVAVARALQDREPGRGVIVFDESSRAIPHDALPEFYKDVRFIAAQGTTVLMVSHNLKEVLELCDRVTVLRNGKVVEAGVPTQGLSQADLTRMILGREHAHDLGREPSRSKGAPLIWPAPRSSR